MALVAGISVAGGGRAGGHGRRVNKPGPWAQTLRAHNFHNSMILPKSGAARQRSHGLKVNTSPYQTRGHTVFEQADCLLRSPAPSHLITLMMDMLDGNDEFAEDEKVKREPSEGAQAGKRCRGGAAGGDLPNNEPNQKAAKKGASGNKKPAPVATFIKCRCCNVFTDDHNGSSTCCRGCVQDISCFDKSAKKRGK